MDIRQFNYRADLGSWERWHLNRWSSHTRSTVIQISVSHSSRGVSLRSRSGTQTSSHNVISKTRSNKTRFTVTKTKSASP